ncbi:MAG: patatin-like phospholipase family protein [Halieaceae bacterium]
MRFEKFRNRVLSDNGEIKRILAIDGGGLRAVLTAQMLKKIEAIIRRKTGNPDAVLRDHYHLVGGTSTGSMVSALIALGHSASEIESMYLDVGRQVFKKTPFRWGLIRSRFPTKAIEQGLQEALGADTTMEDVTNMGIGYTAIAKRLDTASVWPITNNPNADYFDAPDDADYVPNKDYKLWRAVRASAAAPGAFSPEVFQIAEDQRGFFLDGGVSPHNYPALQLYMQATIEGYGYEWKTGADNIHVLSLGTGQWKRSMKDVDFMAKYLPALATGGAALASLMNDCRELNELMMQWMGKQLGPRDKIDSLIGDLSGEVLAPEPLFSYTRYNLRIEKDWLKREFQRSYTDKEIKALRNYKSIPTISEWQELGSLYAEKYINEADIL